VTGRRLAGLSALLAVAGIASCFSSHEPEGPDQQAGMTCERAELPAGPDSAIVIIRGFRYEPAELTVAPGTRVVWINCEPEGTAGHTTTADAGAWDSPTLLRGDVFSTVADEAGTFPYHCRPHPGIRGELIVTGIVTSRQRARRLARR